MSSVAKKEIATKKSGHGAVAPGAISPVTPPAPPVPTPFLYTARTSDVTHVSQSSFLEMENPVLVEDSCMKVGPPANAPSQSAGGDIITHAACKVARMHTASMALKAGGKSVCGTGDLVRMNVMTADAPTIAQMIVPLLNKVDFDRAQKSAAKANDVNEEYYRAFHPERANQTNVGDPIDVGTGFVTEEATDLRLPGPIELVWRRSYSSGYHKRRTALGRGGWIHSFEQRVEPSEKVIRLHDEDGLPVDFAPPPPGEASYHRGRRLELRVRGKRYRIESVKDGVVREFAALPGGRCALASITDAYGHRIELRYRGDVLAGLTDACGRDVRVTGDEKGRVTRVEVWAHDPGTEAPPTLQTWFDYAYHVEGTLASHTNALSDVRRWEYDGLHRMVKTTARDGLSFHYQYEDEEGPCVRTWGDGGLHDIHLTLDEDKGEARTHGTARARRYQIKDGVVLREETFDESWSQSRELDADRLLIKTSNGAGESFTYEYDARGHLIKETDPEGNVSTWEYVADRAVRWVDGAGLETIYRYDGHGALVGLTLPTGASFSLTRDGEGRVVGVFGPNGTLAKLGYDVHGNLATETSSRGDVTRYRHDALGRPVERWDPAGLVTRIEYDRLGQVLAITSPDRSRWTATYDPTGNVLTNTDGAKRTTRFEYSGTGHLTKIIPPDGQALVILHDADERPVEVVNALLERYRLEYDRADRVVSVRTFDGRLLQYRHDRAGRVTRIDHPEGEWRELRYDKLGNVLEDRGPDVQIAFERDSLGRIVKAVCSDAAATVTTEIERDRWGRVVAETQCGRTVRYEYDALGRRTARVAPGGERTEYRYDDDDLLVGLRHEGREVSFHRDGLGRERRRELGAFRLDSTLDALGRIYHQQVITRSADGEHTSVSRLYEYNVAGLLAAVHDERSGGVSYRYDRADRLLEAASHDRREAFEYDPTGSLVSAVRTSARLAGPWAMAPGNVLKATRHARYVYDGRSRRIQRIDKARPGTENVTLYGWDTKDRLREIVLPDGRRVRFTYDAFGRRVRKVVLAPWDRASFEASLEDPANRKAALTSSVEFSWDGDVLCEERHRSEQGQRTRVHVYDPGTFTPILQSEEGKVFAVVVDQVGTVKELVDEVGRVAFRARHGAWGEIVAVDRDPSTQPVESPFRLLGQYADEETGLCSTRFRYFEPSHARWLSPDPLHIQGGLNLMGFDGAPTSTVDPLGLAGYPDWHPHSPTDDWAPQKGTHFYTDDRGVELGVRTDGRGNVTFEFVAGRTKPGTPTNDAAIDAQRRNAEERLRTDAAWRWRLLRNLCEGMRQFASDPNEGKRAFAASMDRVRAALAALIARKGHV